jgi:hypothetical protein
MQRLGDRPRLEVLLQRQRLLEERLRVFQRVGALRDAELAEVLPRSAVKAHVVGGEEGEARVRPPGAVRIDRVARELAEVREREAKRIHVVGVAGEAGDNLGIAGLHGARGAP